MNSFWFVDFWGDQSDIGNVSDPVRTIIRYGLLIFIETLAGAVADATAAGRIGGKNKANDRGDPEEHGAFCHGGIIAHSIPRR